MQDPVQIITFTSSNSNQPKLKLTNEGITLFQQIKDKKLSVVTVAGPQRSGKSFLANRLLHQQNGFKVGPTTQPCTQGIWAKHQPITETHSLLVLDTEGLNSSQRNQQMDNQLFSIAILMSSVFVFNQLGRIDEQSIEQLDLVLSLNTIIQGQKDKFAFVGPSFFWVLRDFALDLKNQTPEEYLEAMLSYQSQDKKKNEIRQHIKNHFKIRECHVLVRPLDDENKLATIEDQDFDSLREPFKKGMLSLEKRIKSCLQPKRIDNTIITGQMLLSLVFSYIEAINQNGVPQILTSLENVKQQSARKIRESMQNEFDILVSKTFGIENLPIEQDQLLYKFHSMEADVLKRLEKETKDLVDFKRSVALREDIKNYFSRKLKEIFDMNKEMSQTLNN